MPIQVHEEDGGKIVVIEVSGKLVQADYEHLASEFERLVRRHGRLRVLFEMSDFHGWDASALWEDVKFDVKHFADIERLAMVGDARWQHGLATFWKPFTKATIRSFDHADTAAARKWLEAENETGDSGTGSGTSPRDSVAADRAVVTGR